jgi:hypothetical protein
VDTRGVHAIIVTDQNSHGAPLKLTAARRDDFAAHLNR